MSLPEEVSPPSETPRAGLDDHYRLLFERMPLACILHDANFRIIDWNPAAEKTFGFAREDALGKKPYDLIVPESARAQVEEIQKRVASGETEAHATNENRTKDGRALLCEWNNTPVFDEAGRFVGFLSMGRDITEQSRMEDQLRQAQKMEAIGRLAGGIAHDFNNLLTVINGYTELALERLPESDPLRVLILQVLRASDRASALTGQLLAFSRKQIRTPIVLDLNELIRDMSPMLGRLIGEDIELGFFPTPGLGRILVDPVQLEQVVMNLAINARDAMPRGGRLTIETHNVHLDAHYLRLHPQAQLGAAVLLAVSDTGIGMDAETRSHIFEPFFTTKGPTHGTGLGLSTVYGIVTQGRGHIEVYSEPGRGSTFKVYFPSVADPSAGPETASDPDSLAGPIDATLLLTEDDPGVRSFARLVLESEGYRVLDASNGEEALDIASNFPEPIHLLISDVVMPRLGGRELAERLVALRPGLKVLFLSGYAEDAVVRHGVLKGDYPFLSKPFRPDALGAKVREVLGGGGMSSTASTGRI